MSHLSSSSRESTTTRPPTTARTTARPTVRPAAGAPPSPAGRPAVRARIDTGLSTPTRSPASRNGTPTEPKRAVPGVTPTKLRRPVSTASLGDRPGPSTPRLSMKEQIALKRAEVLKSSTSSRQPSQLSSSSIADEDDDDDDLLRQSFSTLSTRPTPSSRPPSASSHSYSAHPLDDFSKPNTPDEDAFGRDPEELIYRGASTGRINLSTLSLSRIPSSLFTLLLGLSPSELSRPPTPPPSAFPASPARGTPGKRNAFGQEEKMERKLGYYDVVDLVQLKVGGNMLKEVEPEIGLFGGLKILDLRGNMLCALPDTMADLRELGVLDLSQNQFTEIPKSVLLLPLLSDLNLSSNLLTTISFSNPTGPTAAAADTFGSSAFSVSRKKGGHEILPHLRTLGLAGNRIDKDGLGVEWPKKIQTLDLGGNDLSETLDLAVFSALKSLTTLKLAGNTLTGLAASGDVSGLAALREVDLGGNKVVDLTWVDGLGLAQKVVAFGEDEWGTSIGQKGVEGDLVINLIRNPLKSGALTTSRPPLSTRTSYGAESTDSDYLLVNPSSSFSAKPAPRKPAVVEKPQWEIDANKGLNTEGGKKYARAIAGRASDNGNIDTEGKGEVVKEGRLAGCWNERRAELEISSAIGKTLLGPSGELSLAKILDELDARVATITVHPLSGLKSLSLGTGQWESVTTVSITYTSLKSDPTFFAGIARAFPKLQNLDLSGSRFENIDGVGELIKAGLKSFKVKDGRLAGLGGLEEVARAVKDGSWKGNMELVEVDVRDNDISQLEPILGCLPLTSFLVENNAFRIPQRRVWEKEGTKGLLAWLKDRSE